jgi:cellulose synthase operon protein C
VALGFRDSEALYVVVTSGLCAPDIVGQGARVARRGDGSLVLAPQIALPPAQLRKLQAVGVVVDAELPAEAQAVRCWAEAIAMRRIALPVIPSLVLLVTERAAGLVELAAELVRLGCDRQELCTADGMGVLRVVDPPTYTVMRAIDHEAGLRAFAPDPAGQDAVWTELGYRHPLADRLRAEPGSLLLVGGDRWRVVREPRWLGLDAVLELVVPGAPVTVATTALARRTIELRLAGGRREAPSLWVIRHGGVEAIDRLLAYLPETVVAQLTFAVTAGAAPEVILRARAGRHAAPELALDGTDAEAYAPVADMPDVYAPAGAIVEPPLRRERLRAILDATASDVLWLAALPERRFRVERIADRAFRPLAEWAEYVLHASAPALVPWLRATTFDFAPLVLAELGRTAPRDEPVEPAEDPGAKRAPRDRAPAPARVVVPAAAVATAPLAAAPAAPVAEVEVAIDAALAALEAQFVALDAPGDAPERIALLDQLAVRYARLGRRRDAGLCFARAVWDAPAAEVAPRLDAWIAADRGLTSKAAFDKILAQAAPDPDDVRVIAAVAARVDERGARPELARDPHRVQRWLDAHDAELDARTLWLSRVGLARLAGGDPLGLAHTRDRILARLAAGLPVERELPAFLQFSGRTGALGSASGEHLSQALEELTQRIARTRRKRSMMEAPAQQTTAYVQLQLAHGFARIGKHERARGLVAEARHAMAPVASDPVHAYLIAAFAARVDQAIAGAPPEAALPEAFGARLAALDRLARYKVERLREVSRILEPIERSDAMGGFLQRHHDVRGPEFAALYAIAEPRARARAIDQLIDRAAASEPERARLLGGILDVLLELAEADAVPILGRAWPMIAQLPATARAVPYADALVVAGHFGRTELVPALLGLLGAALRSSAGADVERVLHRSLRALRRIGLRAEIAELLADAEHAAGGPEALRARLAIAAGLAYLGDAPRALVIFDQARAQLNASFAAISALTKDAPRPPLTAALDLTRALALAYAQAPLGNALGGIAELSGHLRDITDNLSTNSHYCLSVLHFVESLVLGITSDDLALGEAGRRFVEDDEHLIRRRVHRDLGGSP